jgi:hypothetical protein
MPSLKHGLSFMMREKKGLLKRPIPIAEGEKSLSRPSSGLKKSLESPYSKVFPETI